MKRILVALIPLYTYFFLVPNISSVYAIDPLTLCIKESGVVFAVGSGFHTAECKNNDKLVMLNAGGSGGTGILGPQGATGATGTIGATGNIGPTGGTGLSGQTGQQGSTGATGMAGEAGSVGATGASGAGSTGATGMQGSIGATGLQGTAGTNGVSGYERNVGTLSADDEYQKTVTATCTAGKKVIGGGWLTSNVSNSNEIYVSYNGPPNETSWQVIAGVDGATAGDESFSIQAVAICVNAL